MVETNTGTNRSAGISYDDLLDTDTHRVREILRVNSDGPVGPDHADVSIYYDKAIHAQEVERIWKRVWQLACHEDDIPNVGDTYVYNIASLSYVIVRTAASEIRAFPNACMHRGRALMDGPKKELKAIRCPFHGWSWELDGTLKEVPCAWDFPQVSAETHSLSCTKVGRWGGFVFINPDLDAEPLEEFLGDIDAHFTLVPFERRYRAVHIEKILPCNWKLAQEAFCESYHVVATHPTLLRTLGDANSKYDAFGNYSRAISAHGVLSPHLEPAKLPRPITDATLLTKHQHAVTGHIYQRVEEGRVRVTRRDGASGVFDETGAFLEGDVPNADPHLCNWIGGKQHPSVENAPVDLAIVPPAEKRAQEAAAIRDQMRPEFGNDVDEFSDAELLDSFYYSVFPNISPWGSFNPIFYRFRPDGDNPEQCIHECMFMLPLPKGVDRPPAATVHKLGLEDDYMDAPEIGSLAKVFNQDEMNLAALQKGIKSLPGGKVTYGNYQETKIRHFHMLYNRWMETS